jgi:hypothetical protein
MCYRIIVSNFSAVSMAVFLAACGGGAGGGATGPADLVPIPKISSFDPPFFNFCVLDGERLLVTVRNQGVGDAEASTTTVQFSTGGPVSEPTSALAGLVGVDDLSFDIPVGCFTADCNFTITVDSDNVVSESSETNNSVSGRCIG